jgi:hypothetical protein
MGLTGPCSILDEELAAANGVEEQTVLPLVAVPGVFSAVQAGRKVSAKERTPSRKLIVVIRLMILLKDESCVGMLE